MKSNRRSTQSSSLAPLICRVCGDRARGNNFQVLSCMSCKLFFRRNALLPSETLSCKRDGHCTITQITRRKCPACRLLKCFAVGMNARLIRFDVRRQTPVNSHQRSSADQENLIASLCRSLLPLPNDKLTLTPEQWRILSHAIHVYDEKNSLLSMKTLLANRSSLPPKLRFKPSSMLDTIGSFARHVHTTNEQLICNQSLSTNDRQAVVKDDFQQLSLERRTLPVV